MAAENFSLGVEADGIAVVVWDMPGRPDNVISAAALEELEAIVERVATDEAIRGVVIASGKATFCTGIDLSMIEAMARRHEEARAGGNEEAATGALFAEVQRFSKLLRRLETTGKPVAAAINGSALGGGLVLALACHHRVVADAEGLALGLPESRFGLLPGGGGTQRLPRLIGAAAALDIMLRGRSITPREAQTLGIVHEIVAADDLVEAARRRVADAGEARQPWDREGFRMPGGPPYSPQGMQMWAAANALYRKETFDNYDAQRAIMSCVYEGSLVNFDTGLRIESRHLTGLLRGPQARALIRSQLSRRELDELARRPKAEAPTEIRRLGVIGASTIGTGIAYLSAAAGIDVIVVDRDQTAAECDKAFIARKAAEEIERDRRDPASGETTLQRIVLAADYTELAGVDLVVEAVDEDGDSKADVMTRAEAAIGASAVLASTTSTLSINSLAEATGRADRFIGLHFPLPVEKAQLVEVIPGRDTSDHTLAVALDFARRIGRTPIVVSDSRGFFTSRVVATYLAEGREMLAEGVPPAMIENAGRAAGMPLGPLALSDEVGLESSYRIDQPAGARHGSHREMCAADRILEDMVRRGRLGCKSGKGFYDYPADGSRRLWPGLADLLPESLAPEAVAFETLKQRLLAIQALETARCFTERVVTDVREADVGAILGFGFAPFTGGPLSYIDMEGATRFVARCHRFATAYGPRFLPNALLCDMAQKGDGFYSRFAPDKHRKPAA